MGWPGNLKAAMRHGSLVIAFTCSATWRGDRARAHLSRPARGISDACSGVHGVIVVDAGHGLPERSSSRDRLPPIIPRSGYGQNGGDRKTHLQSDLPLGVLKERRSMA